MAVEAKTLKLLHRLTTGDAFFLEVRGLPNILTGPKARLLLLRFYRQGGIVLLDSKSLDLMVTVGESLGGIRSLVGVVPQNLEVGMYLLATVTFMARTLEGRFLTAHIGNSFVPVEPRLGFCIDHDICDISRLEWNFDFAELKLL